LKLFSFIQTKSFDTCVVTQISCIQVCPTKFTFVKIKSKENFGEFLKFFIEGLNPLKFIQHSNLNLSKSYNINFVGNLKSTQLKAILRIFQSSLMQSSRIFGAIEGIRFKFTISSYFWKIEKKFSGRPSQTVHRCHSDHGRYHFHPWFSPPFCCRPWFLPPIKLAQGCLLLAIILCSALAPLPLTPCLATVGHRWAHPCCPTGPIEPPQRVVPPAPSPSPGHWLPKPGNRGSHAAVFLREL
jgi:hypothetical protein